MKFVEAIKAMGPGQLLANPHGCNFEITDGFLKPVTSQVYAAHVLYQDIAGWQVIDKPRPRVRFADAIAAAAKGATIKSCESELLYVIRNGSPCYRVNGEAAGLSKRESIGDWEVIEPEGDK